MKRQIVATEKKQVSKYPAIKHLIRIGRASKLTRGSGGRQGEASYSRP